MGDRRLRAEHYRNKAEETRIIAESMTNLDYKKFLMGVSVDYIMLARLMDYMADPMPASEDFELKQRPR